MPKSLANIDYSKLVLEDLGAVVKGQDGVYQVKHEAKIDAGKVFETINAEIAALGGVEEWESDGEGGFGGPP